MLFEIFAKIARHLKSRPAPNVLPSYTSSPMQPSIAGLKFLQGNEGCRLKPYLDNRGVPTIGYGSTRYEDGSKVTMQDPPITQERVDSLFATTLKQYIDGINAVVHAPLTQNQFDAVLDFTYNLGVHAFATSTLLQKINTKDYAGAAEQFLVWDIRNPPVHARRKRERELFLAKS